MSEPEACAARVRKVLEFSGPDPIKNRIAVSTGDAIERINLKILGLTTSDDLMPGRGAADAGLKPLISLLAQAVAELDGHYARILQERWRGLSDALLDTQGAAGPRRWLDRLRVEDHRIAKHCADASNAYWFGTAAGARVHHLVDVLEAVERAGSGLVQAADDVTGRAW